MLGNKVDLPNALRERELIERMYVIKCYVNDMILEKRELIFDETFVIILLGA